MKKIVLALLVLLTGFTFVLSTYADEAETGDVVVHFHKWDNNYDGVGAHAWGSTFTPTAVPTGTDDFGIYFEFKDVEVGTELGFIAVYFDNPDDNSSQNWDRKLTGDVKFEAAKKGETVHVYVFEGADSDKEGDQAFVAKNDMYNMLLVYADPSGNYEENLGVHAWGWEFPEPQWNEPKPVFSTAASNTAIKEIKVAMLHSDEPTAGLLVYYGNGDDSKKTGDVKLEYALGENPVKGDVGFAYVVNKGDGYTKGDNVFYNVDDFAEEAFSFKLMPMSMNVNGEIMGTYAQNPTTVMVSLSSPTINPYLTAKNKEAAKARMMTWFTVREVLGEDSYGERIDLEDLHFAQGAETVSDFVLILKNELDPSKDYEVVFENLKKENDKIEYSIEFNVKLDVPLEEGKQITIPGNFSNWEPENLNYSMTKIDELNYKLEIDFELPADQTYMKLEYKYASEQNWDSGVERVSGNRVFFVSVNSFVDGKKFVINDTVTFDETKEELKPNTFAEPVELLASLDLNLDKEAPVIEFVTQSLIGKPEAQRIIEVPWGKPFNMNLFPRYEVIDNRDGNITGLVYVPKGDFSKLNTKVEGDYVIMLEVVDAWGNVAQEKFTFRVKK